MSETLKRVLSTLGRLAAKIPGWIKVAGWLALGYYAAAWVYRFLRTGHMADWVAAIVSAPGDLLAWIRSTLGGEHTTQVAQASAPVAQPAGSGPGTGQAGEESWPALADWVMDGVLWLLGQLNVNTAVIEADVAAASRWLDTWLTATVVDLPGFQAWLEGIKVDWVGLYVLISDVVPVLEQVPLSLVLVIAAAQAERMVGGDTAKVPGGTPEAAPAAAA